MCHLQILLYYEVDERVQDWVMGSAAKKWRDFKSDLKALCFHEEKTDEELLADCDARVHEDDWKWLIDHWRTDAAKQRSEIGKLNRQGMTLFHTTGSKSHARVIEEEHKKNGYPPRRDEAFVITHTSKKGVPSNTAAAQKIKELENKANEQPELLEKTIEQGDLFSHVFGKERNGYVRCIGMGPSASYLRMPGTRKLKSTKLQMAEEECRQAMEEAALLRERVEATDRKMDIVMNDICMIFAS
ncbi:uncharacterized protein [Aegilops tauschii subsp. strangulata]|uniref:uncharacterized protein isoform X1 n=2 Tax=Aegilops tauschii subsp. strangulata TaxID=200361 RepID=UPI001ABC451F|nr:uncharacterized protein LOC109764541 isoform X1 [Aegilops tauschii subsp. strangulata]